DIAEIFKPLLVDRLIFSCLNKKILKKSDFEEKNGTVRFKEKPRLEFVRLFEERMKKTIDFSGQQITYEMLMEREIHKLERTVTDDKPYLPYCSEW
ncbi:MAG TPA: CRISPR-associated endonuclease Cas1, partial [Bacillota bacterium]|nr:CRISPR-associated endonuclease Cas1 [Bacillota bacterium]